MRRAALLAGVALVGAVGCGGGAGAVRAGFHPTAPPGWVLAFTGSGNRSGHTPATLYPTDWSQLEVYAWASGDVQDLQTCLLADENGAVCSSGTVTEWGHGRIDRHVYLQGGEQDGVDGPYFVGVDFEGAGTWHVVIYGQPASSAAPPQVRHRSRQPRQIHQTRSPVTPASPEPPPTLTPATPATPASPEAP